MLRVTLAESRVSKNDFTATRSNDMLKYYLLTILFAMIPIFELRGAIPAAVWGYHINPIVAYIIAVIGNMIPVPFIYLFARKVLEWGKDKRKAVRGSLSR